MKLLGLKKKKMKDKMMAELEIVDCNESWPKSVLVMRNQPKQDKEDSTKINTAMEKWHKVFVAASLRTYFMEKNFFFLQIWFIDL